MFMSIAGLDLPCLRLLRHLSKAVNLRYGFSVHPENLKSPEPLVVAQTCPSSSRRARGHFRRSRQTWSGKCQRDKACRSSIWWSLASVTVHERRNIKIDDFVHLGKLFLHVICKKGRTWWRADPEEGHDGREFSSLRSACPMNILIICFIFVPLGPMAIRTPHITCWTATSMLDSTRCSSFNHC